MPLKSFKPRVFLSHSKSDIAFIEKVCTDFRRCQIEPWIDSEEIRHGKPWMETIFKSGIPVCDSVFVYFTANSLNSTMVKKEIDAGLIQQMSNNGIAFLPYVSSKEIRAQLRPDIQSLQAPIWNEDNYNSLLPVIVAEIWRSFFERGISEAIMAEQNLRLKKELELQSIKAKLSSNGGIFTTSENQDYQYIWQQLDRQESFKLIEKEKIEGESKYRIKSSSDYLVHIGSLVAMLGVGGRLQYKQYRIKSILSDTVKKIHEINEIEDQKLTLEISNYPEIFDELLMFGFIDKVYLPQPETNSSIRVLSFFSKNENAKLVFSNKFDRFKYWLAVNRLLPESVIISEMQ